MEKLGYKQPPETIRHHYANYIDPRLNQSKMNDEEIRKLFWHHQKLGSNWRAVSKQFTGRSANLIKNTFNNVVRTAMRRVVKLLGFAESTFFDKRLKHRTYLGFLIAETISLPPSINFESICQNEENQSEIKESP